ncbi:PTS sugar transporter subunit IIA [Arcanobacterium hippocoleae]|uniref:Glucose-specific phosphotransferase system IIA component n=1 Tax=Arcanobacterium hippocoleae TaxID=149017 RepID=A0ABU1T399_9ACTO|nr:PTS glucose transporter subunit IIA [Arcanobacterium hippocoleae]MDR6939778.1 glucose-specific phosphotransferase system IIA component [Arcanobacterium hippocoleae]
MFFGRSKKVQLIQPFAGKIVGLSEVPDEMFAQKMLGDGFAVEPSADSFDVVAPISGTLLKVFSSLHAFAMKSDEGLEILVHIGLETVELKGAGFTELAHTGEHVAAGTPVVHVDGAKVKAAGYNLVTPVVLTNQAQVKSIAINSEGAQVTLN